MPDRQQLTTGPVTELNSQRQTLAIQERLASILAETEDLVAVFGPTGQILYLNRSGRQMVGIGPEEELAERNVAQTCPRMAMELGRFQAIRPADGDANWHGDISLCTPTGTQRVLSMALTAHLGAGGKLEYVSAIGQDVTDWKQAEKALRDSELRFRHVFDDAPIGIVLTALDGRILQVNRALCDWIGYSEAEILTMGLTGISHPDDLELNLRLRQSTIAGEVDSFQMEKRYRHKSGQVRWGMLNSSLVCDADETPQYFVAMVRDITEQRLAQEALQESQERFRSAFDYAAVGMAVCDPADFRILQVNPALCEMLGYSEAELLRMTFKELYLPDNREYSPDLQRLLSGEIGSYQVEREYRHRLGHAVWGSITVSAVRLSTGKPLYLVVQTQDITERKRVEERLLHAANHDPLTDLHNRRHFAEELERRLAETRRYGTAGALMFLDLDHFKEVNDRLGHATGDEVLRQVALLLRREVRATDILGRFGGDEFAILLTNTDGTEAVACAQRILRSIPECTCHFRLPVQRLTTSIGIALFPDHGGTVDELLACADTALYRVKSQNRDGYALFTPEGRREVVWAHPEG